MSKLNVGTRLAVLTAILVLVAASIGVLGLRGMEVEKERLETVYEDRTVALVQLAAVLYDTLAIRRQIDLAQEATTQEEIDSALDKIHGLDASRDLAWRAYLSTVMTRDEQQLVDQTERHRLELFEARNKVIAAYREGGKATGLPLIEATRLDQQFNMFHADMGRLIDYQARFTQTQYLAVRQSYPQLRMLMSGALAFGVFAGVLAAWLLSRSITRPLAAAITAADSIAGGDFSTHVAAGGHDEFGNLLRALTGMRNSLRVMSEEIRARIAQLEDMSNALPLAVFQARVSPNGQYVYNFMGHHAAEILGVSVDELVADPQSRWRNVHPDDLEHAQSAVSRLATRAAEGEVGAHVEVVTRVEIAGETRFVYSTAYAAAPVGGGHVTLSGYYQDITQQRRAQQLLQDVIDNCPSLVFAKDLAGEYLMTNRAFDQALGLLSGGGIGKTDADLFAPEFAERVRKSDASVIAECAVRHFEETVAASNGMRTFSLVKFPLVDAGGRPYALCAIASDVTDSRVTENALRDSESYNRVLFQESHVPIVVVDPTSGRLADANMAAARIHGFACREDLIGRHERELSAPGQYVETDTTALAPSHPSNGVASLRRDFERRKRRHNGEIWDAMVHESRFQHGGATLVLRTVEDITIRKVAEHSIRAAKDAAEAAARVKSDFLAVMSHEIRTPLNAILGNLELLGYANLPDSERERVRAISASSRTLLDMINDILDFSKAEAGKLEVEEIGFDIVECVEHVGAMFAPSARAKSVNLRCVVSRELPRFCLGDPVRLRQVMVNLVSNAIKFTDAGSVTIELRLARAPNGSTLLVIAVSDTGIGVPRSMRDALFEPFQQADSSITRRYGGTGLGLALSKRLTELMGGTIAVEDRPGGGSTFVVTLPLRSTEAGRLNNVEVMCMPVAPRAIRALVAEDHPANRALMRDQLTFLGYEVDFANDGEKALAQFGRASYDVVLTDLSMPRLDGYALASRLREKDPSIPIIAVTAHTTADEHRRCMAVGIDRVLVKPFSLSALEAILSECTANRLMTGFAQPHSPAAKRPLEQRPNLPRSFYDALFSETRKSLLTIGEALALADVDALRRELHSLKGAFLMAREPCIADACRSLEDLAKARDMNAASEAYSALQALVRAFFQGMGY